MGLIQQFLASATEFIRLAPKVNGDNRERIRTVVLSLSSELERGCDVIALYLQGAKRCDSADHIRHYLGDPRRRLLEQFDEFNICHGLYTLHDEYRQLFNSIRLSVDMGEYRNIGALLTHLVSRERAVIDEVLDGMQEITALAYADGEPMPAIVARVDGVLATVAQLKADVRTTARHVIDSI